MGPLSDVTYLVSFGMQANFVVRHEPDLAFECSLTVCAYNPVDVQLFPVFLCQVRRQVGLGN